MADPLFAAVHAGDLAAVRRALADGANPRRDDGFETPLHLAARIGSAEIVEALLLGGALEWQQDRVGRTALDRARESATAARDAIVTLLDRTSIADASFRRAVAAIHAGDAGELARLIDAEPRLLRERIFGDELSRHVERPHYFRDPKLFWFVANNPTRMEHVPATIVDVARVMIARGVERDDLTYALELVMSSGSLGEHQLPLARAILAGGAELGERAVVVAAAHRELGVLRALVSDGALEPDANVAASLSLNDRLPALLAAADSRARQTAFGLAVINANLDGARVALDAGVDVDGDLPVHAHATALHQAAINDDVPMLELLLAHGARRDVRDRLWDVTPLDWAIHEQKPRARAYLEALE